MLSTKNCLSQFNVILYDVRNMFFLLVCTWFVDRCLTLGISHSMHFQTSNL